jgi:hypothetical protein
MKKYRLVKFKNVDDKDIICADNGLSDAEKIAFVVGLNSGAIKEEDFLWFGFKTDYCFGVGPDDWVIRQIEESQW